MISGNYTVTIHYRCPNLNKEKTYQKHISASSPTVAVKRAVKFAPNFVKSGILDIVVTSARKQST